MKLNFLNVRRAMQVVIVPAILALSAQTSFGASIYGLSSSFPATGTVYTLNPITGAATPVVNLTGDSFSNLVDIDFLNGLLYATDVDVNNVTSFGTINLTTGAFTKINSQGGSDNWFSLAAVPSANLLYAVDLQNNVDTLVSITPGGIIATIGSTGLAIADMTYDASHDILYGISTSGDLYTINRATGTPTLVGGTGGPSGSFLGLAYDSANSSLYLNDGTAHSLYKLSTGNGQATLVGANGVTDTIDGLAFGSPGTGVPEPQSMALMLAGMAAICAFRRRAFSIFQSKDDPETR